MNARDGGPAFPKIKRLQKDRGPVRGMDPDWVPMYAGGMSLRDYFAGQALAGLVTMWEDAAAARSDLTSDAYLIADAMLEAREDS